MSTLPVLGYWDIRAFAEPIRYLLKYSDIQFEDKRYEFGEGTTLQEIDSIRKNWNPVKYTLDLDFPNLPYYIDGDVKLSQSVAILRYLGRKYGLFATDEKSLARQDLVEQQIQDVKMALLLLLYNKADYEKSKPIFINETLPKNLELLSKFLGTNEWLVGKLTYVDFLAYETFDWLRQFSPESFEKFDNLVQYLKRVESLPAISAYIKSDEFKSWPLFGPFLSWGYKKIMSTLPTLGYWNIRGLAEPIRYLLKYKGIQFIDKRYEFGEGNSLRESHVINKNWNPVKFELGLDFPNLPYYIDGDVKLSQSLVILRYLGRKYDLIGTDQKSLARQDLVEQQIQDLRISFVWGLLMNKSNYDRNKPLFLKETLPTHLELLSKFLGTNEWLVGKLNYVDFLTYETLDWLRQFSHQSVQNYDNLIKYMHRFESIPQISAYINSDEFKNWPLFAPIASWGHFK